MQCTPHTLFFQYTHTWQTLEHNVKRWYGGGVIIISAFRRARDGAMRDALCRVAFPRSLRVYSRTVFWQAVMLCECGL